MAEQSLSENELGGGEKVAFARTVELPPYEPDLKAYEVDPANDPYRRFTGAIEAGGTMWSALPSNFSPSAGECPDPTPSPQVS